MKKNSIILYFIIFTLVSVITMLLNKCSLLKSISYSTIFFITMLFIYQVCTILKVRTSFEKHKLLYLLYYLLGIYMLIDSSITNKGNYKFYNVILLGIFSGMFPHLFPDKHLEKHNRKKM